MGNMATENAAGNRIEQLLDAGSFVKDLTNFVNYL